MKVIGAGFGRTGTTSLKSALEILGFGPCYHMFEVFDHPNHIPLWELAGRGQPVDFVRLFQGWGSAVDWPASAFYQELMELYPEAKVILGVRDPERWYQSCLATIYPASARKSPEIGTDRKTENTDVPEADPPEFINRIIWQNTFHGRFDDHDYAIEVYRQHLVEVIEHVPADRLLVFEAKQGWEPLCNFLGVPTPTDQPYPHLNDTASFLSRDESPKPE